MRPNITFNVPNEKFKEDARREAEKRGETLNAAALRIFELGLPIYMKEVPVKYKAVTSDSAEMPVEV